MLRVIAIGTAVLAGLVALGGCGRIDFGEPLTYRNAVLADAPVGYWRLGDLGTTASDETGHVNGVLTGACTPGATGAIVDDDNTAIESDGSNGVIALDDSFQFPGTAPFTIEAWVEISNVYSHFFTQQTRTPGGPIDGYALLYSADDGGLYLERAIAQDNVHSTEVELDLTGRFTYVVGVYDGTQLMTYINAVATAPIPDVRPLNNVTGNAMIGAQALGAFFEGTIDEVALYDHALTADRVALHYAIGTNGPQ